MASFEFDCAYSAVTGKWDAAYVPTVEHDDAADILISGVPLAESRDWHALTGYTGQYGYRGAVMHASETMTDDAIRAAVIDAGGDVFAIVEVGDGAPCDAEDCRCGPPVGWAVIYRSAA